MTRWFKTLALPLLLVACGPEEEDEEEVSPSGEELIQTIRSCAGRVCQGLSPRETTTCLLERIQAGEPGYTTFPIDVQCAAGPAGTYYFLIHDSTKVSVVLHTTFSNGPDLEDPYDLYGIEVDPQQLNATLETCAELPEDVCPPCLYAMMIGEGIPLETITCDDAP